MSQAKEGATYQHFKRGTIYMVLHLAKDTETEEELVVYAPVFPHGGYDPNNVWVRPKAMFEDQVAGQDRFKQIGGET